MSNISTHVLNTATGKPAVGIRVQLFLKNLQIGSAVTDADGRCPALLPVGVVLVEGVYRLIFETANLFSNGFYPEVSISFQILDGSAHHHVPLLISPFGYTTYRGS